MNAKQNCKPVESWNRACTEKNAYVRQRTAGGKGFSDLRNLGKAEGMAVRRWRIFHKRALSATVNVYKGSASFVKKTRRFRSLEGNDEMGI